MEQAQDLEYVKNSDDYGITDEEGYLLDASDWTRAFTEERARQAGITLTEKHWRLVEFIRDKYLRLGALPPMRTVCKAAGLEKRELKQQFGSCLRLWKMAGLPNPGEEARAYMS